MTDTSQPVANVQCSITCSHCNTVNSGIATDQFAFVAAQRAAGWVVPDILLNKPILCPTCKVLPL